MRVQENPANKYPQFKPKYRFQFTWQKCEICKFWIKYEFGWRILKVFWYLELFNSNYGFICKSCAQTKSEAKKLITKKYGG